MYDEAMSYSFQDQTLMNFPTRNQSTFERLGCLIIAYRDTTAALNGCWDPRCCKVPAVVPQYYTWRLS